MCPVGSGSSSSCAFPHVFLQSGRNYERCEAVLAVMASMRCCNAHPQRRNRRRGRGGAGPVGVLSTMGLHVSRQLGGLCAGIVAEGAFVGLLPSVTASMHRQVGAVLKDLSAELAGVVSTVTPWLRNQMRLRW